MASSTLFRSQFRRCFHHSFCINKKNNQKYDLGIKFKYGLQSNTENTVVENDINPEKWTLRTKNIHNSTKKPLETDENTLKSTKKNRNNLLAKTNRLKRNEFRLNGEVLFGMSPVSIALEVRRREIHRLFVRRGGSETNPRIEEVEKLATDLGVPIEAVDTQTLDELSEGRPHQGVCLDASRLYFASQTTIAENDEGPSMLDGILWLFMDKIHDPMNLGAILRSAYYFGVNRIVTSHGNTCSLTPVVSKASSGAMEIVEVHRTKDSIGFLKSMVLNGFEIVGTSSADSLNENVSKEKTIVRIGEFQWSKKTVILIGNEGLGLSTEHLETCQKILTVPPGRRDLHPKMQSLNVGVATGVILQNASNQLKK